MTDVLEGETWKRVPITRYAERYEVSNLGRIRNIQFPRVLSQKTSTTGYKTINLLSDRRGNTFKVHRLVALAFLPKPDSNDGLVNHRNGNQLDNRSSNLEWGNKRTNSLHAHRTLGNRKRRGSVYIPSSGEISKEIWKRLDHPKFPLLRQRYEISNLGRVRCLFASKGTRLGKIISNHALGGYVGITLSPSTGKAKTFHLHILVALTFHEKPPRDPTKLVIDHADSNPLNPRAENLRWVSLRRNAVLGFGKLTDKQIVEIQRLYAAGEGNQKALAKKFKVTQQHISRVLHGSQRGRGTVQHDLRFKLSEADVNQIRQIGLTQFQSLKAIASQYPVGPTQIAHILAGRTWWDLPFTDGKPWTPIPRLKIKMPRKQNAISQQDIVAILAAYSPGNIKQEDLARQYDVSSSAISRIVSKNRRSERLAK